VIIRSGSDGPEYESYGSIYLPQIAELVEVDTGRQSCLQVALTLYNFWKEAQA